METKENKTEKTINDLNLHEGLWLPFGIFVMRVEAGWIYDCWNMENDCFKQGIFIPKPIFTISDNIKKNLHLCKYCKKDFATCKSNPTFGTGLFNDNIFDCTTFESKL